MSLAIELVNGIKIYEEFTSKRKISALQSCDLSVKEGELVSIIGPSGAGKSTLLRVIAGLDTLSSGEIFVGGIPLHEMSQTRLHEFRRKFIGTFTQFGRQNFDPKMKVRSAIMWETLQAGWDPSESRRIVNELLSRLKMEEIADRRCGKLSAGEAMRVSLLKAVAKQPLIILADEPTGQLDTENMKLLYNLMRELLDDKSAILVASHDIRLQGLSDRSMLILDGRLAAEEEGMQLIRKRSRYFEETFGTDQMVSTRVIVDSNRSMRLPDELIKRMNLSVQFELKHKLGEDAVKISNVPDSPLIQDRDNVVIRKFTYSGINEQICIQAESLTKHYPTAFGRNEVLNNISFTINEGQFVVVLGPSGSGKTTLLNLIAGIDFPSTGNLTVDNVPIHKSRRNRLKLMTSDISYLTQNYIAHPFMTVTENAKLPYILKNGNIRGFPEDYQDVLSNLELEKFEKRLPSELSGGQQQRASLVSTLLKDTKIIIADEPTANLDTRLAIKVLNILIDSAINGKTVVIATHDYTLVQPGFKVLRLANQTIVENVIADENYCKSLHKQYLST